MLLVRLELELEIELAIEIAIEIGAIALGGSALDQRCRPAPFSLRGVAGCRLPRFRGGVCSCTNSANQPMCIQALFVSPLIR